MQDWKRYPGTTSSVQGDPQGTIIALPPIKHWGPGIVGQTPEVREGILNLAKLIDTPVDTIATVVQLESGWDPTKTNSLPAAGLAQLTVGAHLDGYSTKDKILSVAKMSAEQQLREILPALWKRRLSGKDPGHGYMQNFLPDDANKDDNFVIGDTDEGAASRGAPQPSDRRKSIYKWNYGLDVGHKGYITIADVYDRVSQVVARAGGKRITVDGRIFSGGKMPEAIRQQSSDDDSDLGIIAGGVALFAFLAFVASRRRK